MYPNINRKKLNSLLLISFGIVVFLLFITSSTKATPDKATSEIGANVNGNMEVRLATGTVPLKVSGVVQATDRTLVYAQTNGVVSELFVQEGSLVGKGQLLAKQSAPVAEAEVLLTNANGDLLLMEQRRATLAQSGALKQSIISATTATEVATLRSASDNGRLSEVTTTLHEELQSSLLTATVAIDFVNNHRQFFSTEDMKLYNQITADLYGRVPNHLAGSVTYSIVESDDLKALLNKEDLNIFELQKATDLMAVKLDSLSLLFEAGEPDVLDPGNNIEDIVVEQYLDQRKAVLGAKQSLTVAMAVFATQRDAVVERAVLESSNVAVRKIDEETALEQTQYAEQIEEQIAVVNQARNSLAEATLSLARTVAPFAGVITDVLVDSGQYVTAGTPLLTLVGNEARELKVTIPAVFATEAIVGQPFIKSGKTQGYLDRVSPVAEGGGVVAIIALTGTEIPLVGQSVVGKLEIFNNSVYVVPRAYLHFDSTGPLVKYANKDQSRVKVVYDAGDILFVNLENINAEALVPAVSISL